MATGGRSRAVFVVALAHATLGAGCGSSAPAPAPSATTPAPTPIPATSSDGTLPDASCRLDADCILSTWTSDCCCPCAPLHAISAAYEADRQSRAARMHCDRSGCVASACAPCASVPPGVRAVCSAGTCTLASP